MTTELDKTLEQTAEHLNGSAVDVNRDHHRFPGMDVMASDRANPFGGEVMEGEGLKVDRLAIARAENHGLSKRVAQLKRKVEELEELNAQKDSLIKGLNKKVTDLQGLAQEPIPYGLTEQKGSETKDVLEDDKHMGVEDSVVLRVKYRMYGEEEVRTKLVVCSDLAQLERCFSKHCFLVNVEVLESELDMILLAPEGERE